MTGKMYSYDETEIEFEEEEEESDESSIDLDLGEGETDDDDSDHESEDDSESGSDESEGDEDEELEVTIGKEKPDPEQEETKSAPQWVKDLRKEHRETVRRNRQLEDELRQLKSPQIKQEDIGPKPTLEDCGFDADVFETNLLAWNEKKRSVEDQRKQQLQEQQQLEASFNERVRKYDSAKVDLKVKDFADAEDTVRDTLSQVQQTVLIQATESPALVVLALGRNPKKAAEIAAIKDPIQCAAALVRLETQLKVTTKKAQKQQTPPPESRVRGSGTLSASTDRTLEALRAEAEKTGDYTKVTKYKRDKKQK